MHYLAHVIHFVHRLVNFVSLFDEDKCVGVMVWGVVARFFRV